MGTIGATFYVIGIGLLYLVTGTLNMVDMAARLTAAWGEFSRPIVAGLAFITVGIGLKLALFPLHVWLPNAYAYAPSWVTAFLSATATKVAIYLLVRFHFSIAGGVIDVRALPIDEVIVVLSLAAIIIASLIAVFERNLKRLARLFVGRPDRLHHAGHRPCQPGGPDRRAGACRQPRPDEGRALPGGRRRLLSGPYHAAQRAGGHRPPDASHLRRLHDRRLRPGRHAGDQSASSPNGT